MEFFRLFKYKYYLMIFSHKYANHLIILLFPIFFLFVDTTVSLAANIEKIDVIVMPLEAPDLDPTIYETLTNAFDWKLKTNNKYNFIKSTADNSKIKLILLTSILKKEDSYFLKTKIFNKENGTTVALSVIECKKCTVYLLKGKIETLAGNIREVKQNKLKRKKLIEITFKRLEEMDQADNSLFPPEKKINAWQEYLKKYPENNQKKKEVQKRIKLLKIDAAFIETEKSVSQPNSLDEQEKLWTEFLAKYEKTGHQPVIQNAKNRLESIIATKKKEERKERRDRRRRRSK